MRTRVCVWATAVVFLTFIVVSPAWADQHIADQTALSKAIAAKQAADAGTRALVERALDRPDAQRTARLLGLDVGTAKMAVAHLSDTELARLAAPARALAATGDNPDLAGGSTVVTISVTTLLLLLILIVLIAK